VKALPILLLLAGCAAGPKPCPPSVPTMQTVTVNKEIQRPCAVLIPDRPAKLARPLPTDLEQLAAVLAGQLKIYEASGGYADKMGDALGVCTKP
jgi:hypothetical protein